MGAWKVTGRRKWWTEATGHTGKMEVGMVAIMLTVAVVVKTGQIVEEPAETGAAVLASGTTPLVPGTVVMAVEREMMGMVVDDQVHHCFRPRWNRMILVLKKMIKLRLMTTEEIQPALRLSHQVAAQDPMMTSPWLNVFLQLCERNSLFGNKFVMRGTSGGRNAQRCEGNKHKTKGPPDNVSRHYVQLLLRLVPDSRQSCRALKKLPCMPLLLSDVRERRRCQAIHTVHLLPRA
jgi:hypothetical protein